MEQKKMEQKKMDEKRREELLDVVAEREYIRQGKGYHKYDSVENAIRRVVGDVLKEVFASDPPAPLRDQPNYIPKNDPPSDEDWDVNNRLMMCWMEEHDAFEATDGIRELVSNRIKKMTDEQKKVDDDADLLEMHAENLARWREARRYYQEVISRTDEEQAEERLKASNFLLDHEMEEQHKLITFMLSIFDPIPLGPAPDCPNQVAKWAQRNQDQRRLKCVRERIFARIKDISN